MLEYKLNSFDLKPLIFSEYKLKLYPLLFKLLVFGTFIFKREKLSNKVLYRKLNFFTYNTINI